MAVHRRALLGVVVACAAAGSVSAVLAQASRSEVRTAIDGYDTVSYFTLGRPQRGNPAISHVWDGRRYFFASEQHRDLFARDPEKYAPQFAGHCAAGMSTGLKIEADPANWVISDGRLFLFAGAAGPDRMKKDPAMAARGDANWAKMR